MLIVCPACASRYRIAGHALGVDGKSVRCSRCETIWHVALPATLNDLDAVAWADAPEPATEAEAISPNTVASDAVPAESDAPVPATKTRPPRRPLRVPKARVGPTLRARLAGAIGATGRHPLAAVIATLVLLVGFVAQRDAIVRLVPSYAPVYAAMGLPVNLRGVSFSGVTAKLIETAGNRFLVVEGTVVNTAKTALPGPLLRIEIRDAGGAGIYSWRAQPGEPDIEPGARIPFRSRLAAPPLAGREIQVRVEPARAAKPIV